MLGRFFVFENNDTIYPSMEHALITIFKTTAIQILGVFGIFFVFGFILSKLQEWTHTAYRRTLGWFGIIWTAWIGTPFHELSHALLAKVFGHTITELSLFSPNQATGGLGHVDHSYNPKNIYQKLGNFFIGAAPLFIGSFILAILLYFLVPNGKEIFHTLPQTLNNIPAVLSSLYTTLHLLFSPANLHTWNFWLFLYISFAIASHLAPSKEDRRNMWGGFFWIVLILFLVNIIALLLKVDVTTYVLSINKYLGIAIAVLLYATILSFLHCLLANVLFAPFKK